MNETRKVIAIEVLRYRPELDGSLSSRPTSSVLGDVGAAGLLYIKDELDGTLSFRWSCGCLAAAAAQ
jgi:succinate dehydrogenase/fumarate reductase-like Fe-S protein